MQFSLYDEDGYAAIKRVVERGEEVVVETVDPTVDMVASRDAEHVGIEPITITDKEIGGISVDSLYQGLEMRYQNQSAVIPFVIPVEFEFSFSFHTFSWFYAFKILFLSCAL